MAAIPVGMKAVTKEQFWEAVMAESRNIHPSPHKSFTEWTYVGTRQLWGWSSHGYASRVSEPEVFALSDGGR